MSSPVTLNPLKSLNLFLVSLNVSRIHRDIKKEVEQEFLVTKTIQEVEAEREMDVNYVGVYITINDKVSRLTTPTTISAQFPRLPFV